MSDPAPRSPARRPLGALVTGAALGLVVLLTVLLLDRVGLLWAWGSSRYGFDLSPPVIRFWVTTALFAVLVLLVSSVGQMWGLPFRSRVLLLTVVLVICALVLGLISYLGTEHGQTPFWAPLSWTLALFVGNVAPYPGGMPPLSLEVARVTAMMASLASVLQVVWSSVRTSVDRWAILRSSTRVVFVGLDEAALPLLRQVVATRPDDMVVVLDDGTLGPLAERIRLVGARLFPLSGEKDSVRLRSVLLKGRRICAREVYVLHDEVTRAIPWLGAIGDTLDTADPAEEMVHRVLVRVDDPWSAEVWRRDRVSKNSGWLADAISQHEQTARELLSAITRREARHLVLTGPSPISLALLLEIAQERRESRALDHVRHGPADSLRPVEQMHVHLVHPTAAADKDRLCSLLSRYAEDDLSWLSTYQDTPRSGLPAVLADLDVAQTSLVLAVAPGRGEADLDDSLAAERPGLPIYSWVHGAIGIPPQPLVGSLYPFGVGLGQAEGLLPEDRWSRLAKFLHEGFLSKYPPAEGKQPLPAQVPWRSLDRFYQDSNVRQLHTLLSTGAQLDRTWSLDQDGAFDEHSKEDINKLACREHESWRSYYTAHDWRPPSTGEERALDERDQRLRRLNPALVPWEELAPEAQEKARDGVKDAVQLLKLAGYRSRVVPWQRYRMRSEVTATRLKTARTWTDDGGGTNCAQKGDWWVVGRDGKGRSVTDEAFRKTHQRIEGDRYRRTGIREARRAIPGDEPSNAEAVRPASGKVGQWLVRELLEEASPSQGAEVTAPDTWLVDDAHFSANYVLEEKPPPRRTPPSLPVVGFSANAGHPANGC